MLSPIQFRGKVYIDPAPGEEVDTIKLRFSYLNSLRYNLARFPQRRVLCR